MNGGIKLTPTAWAGLVVGMVCALPADAQIVPFSDTEDASLGDMSVGGEGRLHPIGRLNLRNGDYARGSYDDDSSSLRRIPVHIELGLVYDLHDGTADTPDMWFEIHSSNGVHAPSPQERRRPQAWYESNNLVGIVLAPVEGLRTALSYTIKTSPNGVAATSHEASVAVAFEASHGFGWLHPNAVATVRSKGGHGLYTQVGIEPEWSLDEAEGAPSISLPLSVGVGWAGFYQPGSATVSYESVGFAYIHPFTLGSTKLSLRGEMAALLRDRTLAQLDGEQANRARIIPVGQLTLSVAY